MNLGLSADVIMVVATAVYLSTLYADGPTCAAVVTPQGSRINSEFLRQMTVFSSSTFEG